MTSFRLSLLLMGVFEIICSSLLLQTKFVRVIGYTKVLAKTVATFYGNEYNQFVIVVKSFVTISFIGLSPNFRNCYYLHIFLKSLQLMVIQRVVVAIMWLHRCTVRKLLAGISVKKKSLTHSYHRLAT